MDDDSNTGETELQPLLRVDTGGQQDVGTEVIGVNGGRRARLESCSSPGRI